MLVLKTFVNYDQIDEIWVQNVGTLDDGIYEYKIQHPKGDWPLILHKRSDGWKKLAVKVLDLLESEE